MKKVKSVIAWADVGSHGGIFEFLNGNYPHLLHIFSKQVTKDLVKVRISAVRDSEESAVDKFLKGEGAKQYIQEKQDEAIQAERTRIIKALEGLNKPGYCEEWKRIGGCNCGYSGSHDRDYDHNQALDQAIKAIKE